MSRSYTKIDEEPRAPERPFAVDPPPYYQTAVPKPQYDAPTVTPVYGVPQTRTTNVVVVRQEPSTTHVVLYQAAQPDYLTTTIVNMVICLICGVLLGALLLIPALVCAIMAQSENSEGNYDSARTLGRMALFYNIGVYVIYVFLIMMALVVVVTLQ